MVKPGPGHVGAVALKGAPRIDQHTVSGPQSGPVGPMMAAPGVAAEGHQGRKAHAVSSQLLVDPLKLVRQLPLSDAVADKRAQLRQGLVIELGGPPHKLPLLRILYGSGAVQRQRGVHKAGGRVLPEQREQKTGRHVLVHSQRFPSVNGRRHHVQIRVSICIPNLFHSKVLRHRLQLVNKNLVPAVLVQIQAIESLQGLDQPPGEIKNRQRVRNQHLRKPHLLQILQYSIHTVFLHTASTFLRMIFLIISRPARMVHTLYRLSDSFIH